MSKQVELNDWLLSYNFNSLCPSAQADVNSNWPKIETSFAFEEYMSDSVCSLFNSQ